MDQDPDIQAASAPGVFDSAIERASALIDVGKWDHALQHIHSALAADPDSEYAHYLAGFCHYSLSNYKDARNEAKNAIALSPDFPYGYWLEAAVAHQQDRYKEGLKAIATALELDSEEPPFHATRAALLLGSGQAEQALGAAEEALRLDPDDDYAQSIRTLALPQLGRHTEADQQALESLRQSSGSSPAWHQRGVQLFAEGKVEEARQAELEALRLDPENEQAQEALMKTVAAKHPFFSLFWRWTIFLYRFPQRTRYFILFGLLVGVRILRMLARSSPALRPVVIAVLAAYVTFCIYTWVAQPLFRLAVRKGWIR